MTLSKKKRTLVTGGAGFLGSHLCERLLDAGHEINALLSTGHPHPGAEQAREKMGPERFAGGRPFRATALHATGRFSQEAAAQLLLDRGADPNIASSIWFTPLTTAAAQGSGETLVDNASRWVAFAQTCWRCACSRSPGVRRRWPRRQRGGPRMPYRRQPH